MALLFDEAQGAFKDTGSQTSPMKKSTGLMRKQMSKMDEVAPRGHTLAYITPEEAQILNRGGGGIDAQGNQMTGPYGVPMYPGYGSRGYQGAGKASGGDIGYGSQSNQASNAGDPLDDLLGDFGSSDSTPAPSEEVSEGDSGIKMVDEDDLTSNFGESRSNHSNRKRVKKVRKVKRARKLP